MNECSLCFQPIPANRSLCDACENDIQYTKRCLEDAERVFRERQARAACVE
jgi:predicted amidophosphoribosyltransferase